ncbi:MAG: protein kinase domain-containing protein [Vicinamibacterales bacterium]
MGLTRGTRLGPYEIVDALGAGGMGEVYRATDTKLKRQVAIKTLPPSLAADPDRLARFQREAEVLAALNHPHIAAIYGLEEADGAKALVMELVEGPTLADRVARGPIPLDEALPIAGQITEALEAAHDQGIVHRDLKPANIKVRSDGTVKVLDFGLAKALDPAFGIGHPATSTENSPTITSPVHLRQGYGGQAVTNLGVILGTASYMSPEQARGKPLDKRTDIWAFGCVLAEMLSGKRTFPGDDVSDVLASVLAREPELAGLPSTVPLSIRRLLRRCLQKDRNERLRDIGDARIEIRDAMSSTEPEAPGVPVYGNRERLAWIAALATLALALAASLIIGRRVGSVAPEMRVEINTPPTTVPLSFAISPDGRSLAFVATSDGQSQVWLRSLESGAARAIAGTEGAQHPFWSPDNRSVGFFAAGRLRRLDVEGGSVQTLANVAGEGGAWNRDGAILFARLGRPIQRVPSTGGEPVALTGLAQQGSVFSAQFLPDGRHFLYFVRGNPEGVRHLDSSLGQRREAVPGRSDNLSRQVRPVISRRPLGHVSVGRIGPLRNLRPAIPRSRQQVAGVRERRQPGPLAS